MKISREELHTAEFRRAGTVVPDATKILRLEWEADVPSGHVVYLMIVDDEVKKAGKAEDTKSSTFTARMQSELNTLRQVISGPRPGRPPARWRSRRLDPFKQHAPTAILKNLEVELWAKEQPTRQNMMDEEDKLNDKYRGEWTKEGWTKDGRRRPTEGDAD